jgi:hypothetical protein
MMDDEIPPLQSFEEFQRATEDDLAGPAGELIGEGVERSDFQAFMPGVDSDAKCNPVDSIGSSTKSRVSHSERRPSARFPGDKDGSAKRNIEPLQ